jgi:hypothetical protein
MTSFLKLLLIIISIIIVSCGQENKEPIKDKEEIRYDKQKQLDTLNKKETVNLAAKFNAIQSKKNDLKFTYQIQKLIKDSDKLISVTGDITDIVQKEGNYILKIYGNFSKKDALFEISVSPEMFQRILNQFDPKYSTHKGCFIFKPTSIKSSSLLKIDSEVSGGETIDDAESSLTYDFNDAILLFKGNLIDYYVYQRLPKDQD